MCSYMIFMFIRKDIIFNLKLNYNKFRKNKNFEIHIREFCRKKFAPSLVQAFEYDTVVQYRHELT